MSVLLLFSFFSHHPSAPSSFQESSIFSFPAQLHTFLTHPHLTHLRLPPLSMFFAKSTIAAVVAVLSTISMGAARPSPARLSERDFLCGVKDIHCCDQVMSGKEAGDALGGLLALPIDAIGNVGLGCSCVFHLEATACRVMADILDMSLAQLASSTSDRAPRAPRSAAPRCSRTG